MPLTRSDVSYKKMTMKWNDPTHLHSLFEEVVTEHVGINRAERGVSRLNEKTQIEYESDTRETKQRKKRMDEKVQVKLAFEREYATCVLPWLKQTLMVSTYAAVFRTALNTLLMIARIYTQGHKLIEVDAAGRSVGILHIPELEPGLVVSSLPGGDRQGPEQDSIQKTLITE